MLQHHDASLAPTMTRHMQGLDYLDARADSEYQDLNTDVKLN